MSIADISVFDRPFRALTGNDPFPWQREFYRRLLNGEPPTICNIPTGLGKTSIIPIWLIALAHCAKEKAALPRIPRRLVYVVNRRTVVDQSTNEAEKIRDRLKRKGELPDADRAEVQQLHDLLAPLCPGEDDDILAISTLRGQFADNGQWCANPARPAVIVGTVDMIGSRLLFSGYRLGFKSRPLHAGFLGQDALLIHDESHLEPAFQKLLERIVSEQAEGERTAELPWPKLRVAALSATTRNDDGRTESTLSLGEEDYRHPVVRRRIEATKALRLHPCDDEKKKLAAQLAQLALEHQDSGKAILVFVRRVDDAMSVLAKLEKECPEHVVPLTGTMRGRERDELAGANPIFARFMPESDRSKEVTPTDGTVYLVATSAGEVGVNLSADHMVCDLSTFESMAQRFGRVNRFGTGEARIDVVHPDKLDEKDRLTPARQATLELLGQLGGDASPLALGRLDTAAKLAAFAPEPAFLPVSEMLFDAWSLTTIRGRMPGRPPVAPYLHGLADWDPSETYVAWREEVERIDIDNEELLNRYPPAELLEVFPLKPHELLRDRSERVLERLQMVAAKQPHAQVWLVDGSGAVKPLKLCELADPSASTAAARKPLVDRIDGCTVLLPPSVGGLTSHGTLDPASDTADDVANIDEPESERRLRIWSNRAESAPGVSQMRLALSIELNESEESDDAATWDWYKYRSPEDSRTSKKPVLWDIHIKDAEGEAGGILGGLALPDDLRHAVKLAVKLHDHGKLRPQFQATLGNRLYPELRLAKSARTAAKFAETYRHEFGSLLDALEDPEYQELAADMQDVVLHLIATHHGRARPHFPLEEAFDPGAEKPQSEIERFASDVPRRFARVQRRYGRWGLAYLESLLRAADWAASARPSSFVGDQEE